MLADSDYQLNRRQRLQEVPAQPKGILDMFKQLRFIHANLRLKDGRSSGEVESSLTSEPIHVEPITNTQDSYELYGDEINMDRVLEDTFNFEHAPPNVYRKRKRLFDGSLYYFSQFVILSLKLSYKLLAVFGDWACKYPNQTSFFALLIAVYFAIQLLEFSVLDLIELLITMSWPIMYASLRAWEHILRGGGRATAHLDAIYNGLQCDLIKIWCTHFQLRCDQRCSFTESALHHIS